MRSRRKTLISALVVSAIVWAVIFAAWFSKADDAGVGRGTDHYLFGVAILGIATVAGIVLFVSIVSGTKPPPPTWANRDRQDFPTARVVERK